MSDNTAKSNYKLLPANSNRDGKTPSSHEEILVLGDSHAMVFKHKSFNTFFPSYYFNIISIGGATVSGLENPNSKTQALPIFTDAIRKTSAKTTIVLLGEVDTGFVIWYRAEKYGKTVASMLDQAIKNYRKLILQISSKSRVICISTPLPTIQDTNNWGDIANARKDINVTQLKRTQLTIQFNRRMHIFCKKEHFSYLSFDGVSIGSNKLVKASLLNSDPNDHHYNTEKYANMLISKLELHLNPPELQ